MTPKKRYTLVLQRKAVARLIQEPSGLVYFDYMAVSRPYRKNGICTEFVKFATVYFERWPELDIRHQSTVAQRVARHLGYRKTRQSARYLACDLWLPAKTDAELPSSRLLVKRKVSCAGSNSSTEVLYLGFTPALPGTTADGGEAAVDFP